MKLVNLLRKIIYPKQTHWKIALFSFCAMLAPFQLHSRSTNNKQLITEPTFIMVSVAIIDFLEMRKRVARFAFRAVQSINLSNQ